MCRTPSTWHDSSTVIPLLKNRVTEKKILTFKQLVTVEELCQRLLKNPANEFRNTKLMCNIM